MSDSKINDGGPAFPSGDFVQAGPLKQGSVSGGMSLRDYFAGQALAGIVAASGDGSGRVDYGDETVAAVCYETADAMLAARQNGGGE